VSTELKPGDRIGGRYRLVEPLGEGGAGVVWRAINEATSRPFALKVMRREATRDPMAVQRFMQEARAAGSLRHPGIVEVYDVGNVDRGHPFLVMELLEGESLSARLARASKLDPQETARIVAAVARALAHAHEAGIVHRDLKPENVFLVGSATPKVLDFGVSKLVDPSLDPVVTTTGAVLGSPGYMSPEQARGDRDVDARADVWALGVLLHRCLSGALPFEARTHASLLDAIEAVDPPAIEGTPPRMAALVRRCLSRDRSMRPASALEVATELEAIARRICRRPIFFIGVAVCALAVLVAVLTTRRPPEPTPSPETTTSIPTISSSAPAASVAPPAAPTPTTPPASAPQGAPKKPFKKPDKPRQPGF
jgi:serine/threonine-protein kinase